MGAWCCSERKGKARGSFEDFVPGPIPEGVGSAAEIAAQFRGTLSREGLAIVCVSAEPTASDGAADAEAAPLAQALAERLSRDFKASASFVTRGLPGAQALFARNVVDGARLYQLCASGRDSGFGVGLDVHAGTDDEQNSAIFACLADILVVLGTGSSVSSEAEIAMRQGATVLVVPPPPENAAKGGEDVGGRLPADLLQAAVERPAAVSEARWAAFLQGAEAAMPHVVDSVAGVVQALIDETQAHHRAGDPMASSALHVKMSRSIGAAKPASAVQAHEVLGASHAAVAMEAEYAKLHDEWKPRSHRGTTIRNAGGDASPPAAAGATAVGDGDGGRFVEERRAGADDERPGAPPAHSVGGWSAAAASPEGAAGEKPRVQGMRPPQDMLSQANAHMDEISSSRRRMDEFMASLEKKNDEAAVDTQAGRSPDKTAKEAAAETQVHPEVPPATPAPPTDGHEAPAAAHREEASPGEPPPHQAHTEVPPAIPAPPTGGNSAPAAEILEQASPEVPPPHQAHAEVAGASPAAD